MLVLGLTGGIACGKSNVSRILRGLGAFIVDGDELSRRLTAPGGEALPDIRTTFGDGVFLADGHLDRKALGRIVFADPTALEKLNGIMRARLRALIRAEMRLAEAAGAAVCVLDMPLLYEEELDRWCDRVWCVTVPEAVQLRRLAERDGLSAEEARQRIASQLPTAEKAARADVVIDTDRPPEETEALIPALWARELALIDKEAD